MAGPETIETGYAPIKAWIEGVPVEDAARRQLFNVASLPFIHSHVAVMPDVHLGKGATVGSVIATKGAIIPAAVGVDIGCGMMAVRTTLPPSDLPDSLAKLRTGIEAAVPHGGVGLGRLEGRRAERGGPPVRRQRPGQGPRGAGGEASGHPRGAERDALGLARRRQPLHRGVPRRRGARVGHAALGQPRHRQPHRHFLHSEGREALDKRQLTRPLPDKDLALLGKASRCSRTMSPPSPGRRSSPATTAR